MAAAPPARVRCAGCSGCLPFPVEGGDAAEAARTALVTGVASLAPNTYVVGVERGEGCMLVHQLVRRSGDEVPASMLEE